MGQEHIAIVAVVFLQRKSSVDSSGADMGYVLAWRRWCTARALVAAEEGTSALCLG